MAFRSVKPLKCLVGAQGTLDPLIKSQLLWTGRSVDPHLPMADLCDCCQRKLELSAAWPRQSEEIARQDASEMKAQALPYAQPPGGGA